MQPNITHMFEFPFEKTSQEITNKAVVKVKQLRAKIEERELRIKKTREEFKITDEMMVDMLEQAAANARRGTHVLNYSTKSASADNEPTEVLIGAGVVSSLMTERGAIVDEKAAVDRLEIIIRNLKDLTDDKGVTRGHRLSFEELRYLGF